MNLIDHNEAWFVATEQMPVVPTPDIRQIAFYTGMQLEEMGEKLDALGLAGAAQHLERLGAAFKTGEHDKDVSRALQGPNGPKVAKALLDGDIDILWVTVGGARAAGADVQGAYAAVGARNWGKQFEDGTFHRDPTTGKVLKPEGWTPPDLTPFVHPLFVGEEA